MEITLKVSSINPEYEDFEEHQLEIDGKKDRCIAPLSECPEDAIVGRDLVDGHDIIAYIRMGFDAAKRGEELEVEIIRGGPKEGL